MPRPSFAGPFGGGSACRSPTFLTATATLDFPSMNNNEDAVLTMALPGAQVGDAVMCNPLAALEPGLQVSYAYVSDDDVVSIVLHDASGGTVNPAPCEFQCTVVRP